MEKILNWQNSIKILALFEQDVFKEYSVRQISGVAKLDYKTTRKTIQQLLSLSVLKKQTKGKGHFISLNLEHYDVKTLLSFASYHNRLQFFQGSQKLMFLMEEIKKLNLGDSSLMLFGSIVSHTGTKSSDIDLLLLTNNQSAATVLKSLLSNYNLKTDLNVLSFGQYRKALHSRGFNLPNEVLEKHIIFYQPELYWTLTLRGLKDGNRY